MLLRSGKITTTVIPTTKTQPKCSYCNNPGHKINKCTTNNERIKKMNDDIVERTIFSRLVIPNHFIAKKYLRVYLCSHSEINLLMLCYYTKLKKYSTEYKKSSYINLLVEYYYQKLSQNLNTLTHMLSVISDENFEKYTNEIFSNSVSLSLTFELQETIVQLIYHYRPPQRKFNIQLVTKSPRCKTRNNECPICYETYSNTEIIRTGCNHNYCKDCLISYFKSLNNNNNSPSCACCRKLIVILQIKNKKIRDEIKNKYCTAQLAPPPEPTPPPEPATPPPQAPQQQQQQQNTYGPSSQIQRLVFHFISF